ncbi:MAG: sulfurtransferase [Deltaproteobacteria bacterium]|nr:sulfurtransferase [Deltaproteobacteria bacterium]
MDNRITCKDLNLWIAEGRDFIIIDVLPPEYYGSRHIPGARNACVYEMTFLEQIKAIIQDREKPIVLYDSSHRSMASGCAAEKLAAAGFRSVMELAGGIEEWEGSGYPVDICGPELEEEPVLADGVRRIDSGVSRLEWTGRNIVRKHYGIIGISGGELVVDKGAVTSGAVAIDMRTIRNTDLTDKDDNSLLVRHLKSDDFFDVERFPTAEFEIVECGVLVGATPGSPNYFIRGKLTIKGITKDLSVPAIIVPGDDGSVKAHACFDIDRTEWNVFYGSGKLFERLGMHLVNDTISLELFITAN